jgi:hypothetical protein
MAGALAAMAGEWSPDLVRAAELWRMADHSQTRCQFADAERLLKKADKAIRDRRSAGPKDAQTAAVMRVRIEARLHALRKERKHGCDGARSSHP